MIRPALRDTLSQQISNNQNRAFTLQACQAIGGGSINNSYKISGKGQNYFIKINSAHFIGMFAAESQGLMTIAQSNSVLAPKPICHGELEGTSYLVMDYLELGAIRSHDNKHSIDKLGEQLAAMHRHSHTSFGWDIDNTIGSTPQINTPCNSWPEFYSEYRLRYQIDLANANGHHCQLIDKTYELLDYLDQLLHHKPQASLLHGDLWSGNYGICEDGTPVIFDPAVYYGDRETDIAMTELFSGFTPRFYDAYWHHYPKTEGYPVRKTLYNLYHILNHLNLFGNNYYSQADHMVSALLSEVR
ncbi:MAG: fructosamine kinase family protein [Gammaproteobacteria bacterium]|nr:fructosamine kinase family protein [Gammaproteobacteria bacterium]